MARFIPSSPAHLAAARRNPEPPPKEVIVEDALMKSLPAAYRIVALVSAPVAMAVSYHRNKSLLWAFGSGLVSVPYLIYVGLFSRDPHKQAE